MDENNVDIFLEALDEADIDLDDLGLTFDDLEDMDEDDMEDILANIEIQDDDNDADDDDDEIEIFMGDPDEEEEN